MRDPTHADERIEYPREQRVNRVAHRCTGGPESLESPTSSADEAAHGGLGPIRSSTKDIAGVDADVRIGDTDFPASDRRGIVVEFRMR